MAKDPIPDFESLSQEDQHDIYMRMAPHLYAEYVTRDPKTGKSEWVAARHLAYIGKRIAMGVAKGGMRLIVNIAPRFGKSMLISKWVPIWFLENFPTQRVMVCSYTSDLAVDWGRRCRDEIANNKNIRLKIKEDSTAAGKWDTKQGGGMKCQGVEGSITGFGFHLGLIDDYCKGYDEAVSPTIHEKFTRWYEYEFMRRKEPGASVVILGHRFSSNDAYGWLMERTQESWEIITFPVDAEPGDLLGRQPGETLWPERWAKDCQDLVEARKTVSWLPMYQQRPPLEDATRVYDHFTQAENVDQDKDAQLRMGPDEVIGFALDFNANPGGHAEVFQYSSQEDMFRFYDEFHGPAWRTEHIMKAFIEWYTVMRVRNGGKEPWKYVAVYGDRSGNSPITVTTQTDYGLIKKMLNEAGIPFKMYVPFKNPSINDRVLTMNMALRDLEGRVHMKVNPRCKRLIIDLARQPRDENNQPEKEKDRTLGHAADGAGYAVFWVRPVNRQVFKPQRVLG